MSTEPAPVAVAPKKKRAWWAWILFALGALVLCGIVGNMLPDKSDTATTRPASSGAPAAPKATDAPKAHVDKAAFDRVENGMDCDKLADIFGGPGEVMSESELAGIKTTMLDWKAGVFGANVSIMCQDGKVISKAQFGLK